MLRRTLLLLTALAVLGPAAPAAAYRLGADPLPPVKGNPADRFLAVAPLADPPAYDRARRCTGRASPGARLLERWLDAAAAGESWGIERCELWGPNSASLHAEGRAIDWRLDSRRPAERAAGAKLIRLLLAPDRAGQPQALARRMGLQEIIWDCSNWTAGSPEFRRYSPCFGADGDRRRIDPTAAHFDHLHIGLTKAGAGARTTFWRAR